MAKGGKRPGAGRKVGSVGLKTIQEAEARQILVKKILKKWNPIVNTLLDVGLGKINTIQLTTKGKEVVYRKGPDPKILLELLAYAAGRPKQDFSADINLPQLEVLTGSVRKILEKK
jgi:hypothetical protein